MQYKVYKNCVAQNLMGKFDQFNYEIPVLDKFLMDVLLLCVEFPSFVQISSQIDIKNFHYTVSC